MALPLAFDRIPLGGDRNANRDDNIDIDGGLFGGEFLRPYPLSATPTRVVATCAAMDRRPGEITLRPATPGSQRETRMASLGRRRAREGKPRPKMVMAYIRALMANIVTRQHLITAVIEVVWQNEGV